MRDALESLLLEREKKGRAEATLSIYAGQAMRLCERLGPIKLAALSAQHIDDYMAARLADTHNGEPISQNTVSKEVGLLNMALRVAVRLGCYEGDPRRIMPTNLAKDYTPVRRYLRWEDRYRFLAELSEHRRAHAAYLIVSGSRFGPSLRAQPEDIDLEAGTIHIRGSKTERSDRVVPILSHVRDLLTADMVAGHIPFRPWSTTNANRDMRLACERIGIERLSPNDLRRTAATWLRERRALSTEIGEFLGHTTSQQVERVYGRLQGSELGAALEKGIGNDT